MHLVFSYGTLIDKFKKEKKEAILNSNLRLGSYYEYPALIKDVFSHCIEGYIIELSDRELRHADHYEGYPSLYTREKYSVELFDGEIVVAWVYILNNDKETESKDDNVHRLIDFLQKQIKED